MYNEDQSKKRLESALDAAADVEVRELTRKTDLTSLGLNEAYLVDAVHMYVDIQDADSLLATQAGEGTRAHQRVLRFLELYQRVCHLVLHATDLVRVDFQNHRLHAVLYKPYNDEAKRVRVALAIASLLTELLSRANSLHTELPNIKAAIGIDSGRALAVSNGTRGDREPLFLGPAANNAAKLVVRQSFDGHVVRLGPGAASALDDDEFSDPLTGQELAGFEEEADLGVDIEKLENTWKEKLSETKVSDFSFSNPKPPLSKLKLDELTPSKSVQYEGGVIVADVSGFTSFVASCFESEDFGLLVRVLHALRKELRDQLRDAGGRKLRYEGDALIGLLAEGTSKSYDSSLATQKLALVAGGMLEVPGLLAELEPDSASLGLSIGVGTSLVSATRLGVKGRRTRCAVGSAVTDAQSEQGAADPGKVRFSEPARGHLPPELLEHLDDPESDISYASIEAGLSVAKSVGDAPDRSDLGLKAAAANIIIPRAYVE